MSSPELHSLSPEVEYENYIQLAKLDREPTKLKGVLFDLDQTLTDRPSSVRSFIQHFKNDFFQDALNESHLLEQFIDVDNFGDRSRTEVFSILLENLPWMDVKPSLNELLIYFETTFPRDTKEMPGAISLLKALRESDIKTGIVTNGGSVMQQRKIAALDLPNYVDQIIISSSVGISKPKKQIFDLAANNMNLDPSEMLFVGDHPLNDVIGSSAAGLPAVWFKRDYKWPDILPEPTFQAESINDIKLIINKFDR